MVNEKSIPNKAHKWQLATVYKRIKEEFNNLTKRLNRAYNECLGVVK